MQIYRAIPQEWLDALIQYLKTRPYAEVSNVMPVLLGLEIIKPEENKDDATKEGQ